MSTSTIVITYNAASGEVKDRVTSFTVGGTAFGSLTTTQIKLAQSLLTDAAKLVQSPSVGGTVTNFKNACKGDKS